MNGSFLNSLDYLKKIDLSKFPVSEILETIRGFKHFGYIKCQLPIETEIIRARPNDTNNGFYSKCQLSYTPHHLNKVYKRASTPNNSMFYGMLNYPPNDTLQQVLGGVNCTDLTEIPLIECYSFLRDTTTKGYRKVTYGKWNLLKEITCVAIIQHDKFDTSNPDVKFLSNVFNNMLKNNIDETTEIAKYFAGEFAKEETNNEYDYLISAILSEEFINNGCEAILYPSVRVNGEVFNIAIKPEVVDRYMSLRQVVECSIYKYYENCIIDNDCTTFLYPNQTNFILKPIVGNSHYGTEYCLKKLGLRSLDELGFD